MTSQIEKDCAGFFGFGCSKSVPLTRFIASMMMTSDAYPVVPQNSLNSDVKAAGLENVLRKSLLQMCGWSPSEKSMRGIDFTVCIPASDAFRLFHSAGRKSSNNAGIRSAARSGTPPFRSTTCTAAQHRWRSWIRHRSRTVNAQHPLHSVSASSRFSRERLPATAAYCGIDISVGRIFSLKESKSVKTVASRTNLSTPFEKRIASTNFPKL